MTKEATEFLSLFLGERFVCSGVRAAIPDVVRLLMADLALVGAHILLLLRLGAHNERNEKRKSE